MPDVSNHLGRYEVLREIGRGGMATVYVARQIDLDRLVALKELGALRDSDPSFTQRFLREARLAGSLSHPNIVTVHDFFEQRGAPVIAMEYLPRGSLRPYVGNLSPAQVGGVLEGVLAGLAHAETHGIVHRDLKPENLLATDEGRVKIVDFGIAKATNDLQVDTFVTSTGIALGTPNYVAPEQAMAHEVGPWTDLYSIGVVTFELFVGRAPFSDTPEPMAVLLKHINESIPPLSVIHPGVHPVISDWVEWLLAKDPAARPQSARQAWLDLDERLVSVLGRGWQRDATLPEPDPAWLALQVPATGPTDRAGPALLEEMDVAAVGESFAPAATFAARDRGTQARTIMPQPHNWQEPSAAAPPPASPGRRRSWRLLRPLALVALILVGLVATQRMRDPSPPATVAQPTVAQPTVGDPAGTARPGVGAGTTSGSTSASGSPQTTTPAARANVAPTSPATSAPTSPSSGSATERAAALRSVAKQYETAASNVAAVDSRSPTPARATLVDALREAAAAYRRAADADARADPAGYAAALADAEARKSKVQEATQQVAGSTAGPDSGGSEPVQTGQCAGDSGSDDPSDDECEP